VGASTASGDRSHVVFARVCLPEIVSFLRTRTKNFESLRLSLLSDLAGGRGSSGEEVCGSGIGSSQCGKAERGLTSGRSLSCFLSSSPALTFPSSVCSVECAKKQRFRCSCNRTDAATGGRSREGMKKTFHGRWLGEVLGDVEGRED
jgi:hypothetical protein